MNTPGREEQPKYDCTVLTAVGVIIYVTCLSVMRLVNQESKDREGEREKERERKRRQDKCPEGNETKNKLRTE
jgi:hypothetical protein